MKSLVLKKISFTSVLLVCTIARSLSLPVQTKYTFRHLNHQQGLSQSSVLCMLQDSEGFMWFGTKDGLNRYDGQTFRVFKYDKKNPDSLGNNVINALYEDKNKKIWVLTDAGIYIYNPELESFSAFCQSDTDSIRITQPAYQIQVDKQSNIWFSIETLGLFCYHPNENRLLRYPVQIGKHGCNLTAFTVDNENTIWLGIRGKGLYYTDNTFQEIKSFVPSNKSPEYYAGDDILKIMADNHNQLYIGSAKNGLKKIDILTGKITGITLEKENDDNVIVRNIMNDTDNTLLISAESGIYIYNKATGTSEHLEHNLFDPYSLADNAIYNIYKDREGGLWIGSYFGGINYYAPQYTDFEKYYPTNEKNSISGRIVREFCEEANGNLWIGTEDAGLNRFDQVTKTFTRFTHPKLYHNIHALCMDGNDLWIGTFSRGLCRLNLKTRSLKQYLKTNGPGSLNDNSIFSMYKTSAGDLYIGTPMGLNKYNRKNDVFEHIPELEGVFVFGMLEDSNGHLWLASYTDGIFRFNPRKNSWKHYKADKNDSTALPYDKVISLCEDSKKQLWFTTQGGGFSRFDPEKENFTRFDSSTGLPNDVVYKMIEDGNGKFWLTTNRGLVRFCPVAGTYKLYTTANGLLNDQFNYSSGIMTRNGRMYFGGISGFVSFDPNTFIENSTFPNVVITDFLLFNKKVAIDGAESPLTKSITCSDKVVLNYRQNSFAFRFASLSYISPRTNSLSYRLEGFDKEWYTATNTPMATYTNLKPGEYTFKVRSANNAGEWNDKVRSVQITIRPPFWKTGLAYTGYLILITGAAAGLILNFRKKMYRRQQLALEKLNTEKEKEIYQAKIDFFTNVAHEIRTPLSLIKAPLENVLKKEEVTGELKEDLCIMEKNTLRLLDLTNQLLDFRKTETNGFRLDFVSCNICELICEIRSRFNPTAKENGLSFEMTVPEKNFYAPVDKEALTKILSNLFNNAVKYAGSYIRVELLAESPGTDKKFIIQVINDGHPIPEERRADIFKPFVQLKNTEKNRETTGTGIGLPLARSLAELHNGTLNLVDSEKEIIFRLELPLTQDKVFTFSKKATEHPDFTEKEQSVADSVKPTVLVVEDNPEMLAFLTRQLKGTYQVLQARNGLEALDITAETSVDLIISDVMMPEMDGFELCRKMKSDITYSHIPFILLTAKANLQSKIEGIELGADDYIEKPFSVDYLTARIVNLLTAQEKRRQAFASSPFVKAKSVALSKADEAFMEKLTGIVHQSLADPLFNVDVLAEQMNMSRSSLHRKIKEVLKMTPNDFILLERLKTAAELIRSKEYRINEVCYITGFNSSSYFAKCFQKQFGVLPKDFGRKNEIPQQKA